MTHDRSDDRLDFGRLRLAPSSCQGEEWGCAVEYATPGSEPHMLKALHKDARRTLPPGTRYEVRKEIAPPPPGAPQRMGWYRDARTPSPTNTDATPENQEPGAAADGSYVLVGQYRTPPLNSRFGHADP